MNIQVGGGIHLNEIVPEDKPAYLLHFKEKAIIDTTLRIPFPYTEKDADLWIAHVAEETKQQGGTVNWAIREVNGKLIGSIGLTEFELGKTHRAELGYWLAKPYWSRGIMTKAVGVVCRIGFEKFNLVRISAPVFHINPASGKVLEKNGFKLERTIKKHYLKDGKHLDCLLYEKLLIVGGSKREVT